MKLWNLISLLCKLLLLKFLQINNLVTIILTAIVRVKEAFEEGTVSFFVVETYLFIPFTNCTRSLQLGRAQIAIIIHYACFTL